MENNIRNVSDFMFVVERQFPPSWLHPNTELLAGVIVS